ncbi:hypothetical protein FQ775_15690 [Nitratireductor mangrovi]|uniref:Uncharacterized protein n=1 Tax=Nitratireductor mangrovi TaxID=2599600 RepID=A0A5B8L179_9HYPH|nr:hypothetical protein [Nitratireductor mangrovi]QDZ01695.1 hypothetical protein FQ775_15690 [Nitratireductor mangrovi]
MRMLRGVMALMVAGGISGAAAAGSIADKGAEAEKQFAAGQPIAAIETLDSAVAKIWDTMPLTVRRAVLVESVSGYGIYAPRDKPAFGPGEAIVIYVEPIGFAYGKDSLGAGQIAFDIDLAIEDEAGTQVLQRENFVSVETPVRYRNREFHLTVNLNLSGAPTGKYVGRFLLKDRHSDKTAEFDVPFEIAG